MDDDAAVRQGIVRLLRRLGYVVLAAPGGEEAVGLFEAPPRPIDLVLTDCEMPRMRGEDLVERLRTIRPEVRILMMSGHGSDDGPEGVSSRGPGRLRKPFTAATLEEHLRRCLSEGRSTVAS